jgi:hypothetical protein
MKLTVAKEENTRKVRFLSPFVFFTNIKAIKFMISVRGSQGLQGE